MERLDLSQIEEALKEACQYKWACDDACKFESALCPLCQVCDMIQKVEYTEEKIEVQVMKELVLMEKNKFHLHAFVIKVQFWTTNEIQKYN